MSGGQSRLLSCGNELNTGDELVGLVTAVVVSIGWRIGDRSGTARIQGDPEYGSAGNRP
jgi:hypothetical protein